MSVPPPMAVHALAAAHEIAPRPSWTVRGVGVMVHRSPFQVSASVLVVTGG